MQNCKNCGLRNIRYSVFLGANKMTSVKSWVIAIIALLPTQRSVFALDNPIYQNGILTIPHVDTPEMVGKYLDIKMTPTNEGTWKLDTYKEAGTRQFRLQDSNVDLIVTNSLPRQVLLSLTGYYACHYPPIGQINYRLDNNVFDITVHDPNEYKEITFCPAITLYFQRTISLPVFGLKAGTYTYKVNGKYEGSFILDVDNNIPSPSRDNGILESPIM
jgi:hypothetical protein